MIEANLTVQAKRILDELCAANRRPVPSDRDKQVIRDKAKVLWNLASEIMRQADGG